MGSYTFGRVSGALSEGMGLFVEMEADKEKERVRQQWDMAMADMREKNAMARETRMADTATKRYESEQERLAAGDELTAEHRAAQLAASGAAAEATLTDREATRTARESEFVREQVAKREAALDKLLLSYEDNRLAELKELDAFEDTHQADKDEVETRWNSKASTAIQAHVFSLARAEAANPGSSPGYEVKDEGDLRSRLISSGLPAEMADEAATSIFQRMYAAPAQAATPGATGGAERDRLHGAEGPGAPGDAQHAMEQGQQPLFIGSGAPVPTPDQTGYVRTPYSAIGAPGTGPAPATAGASRPMPPISNYGGPGSFQAGQYAADAYPVIQGRFRGEQQKAQESGKLFGGP